MQQYRRWISRALLLFLMCVGSTAADAQHTDPLNPTRPLLDTIARSHLIVIGRLMNIKPDTTRHPVANPNMLWEALNAPGTYVFQIKATLRGKCDPVLSVYLPQMTTKVYSGVSVDIKQDKLYLLLLEPERDRSGTHWNPVDPVRALLPLGNDVKPENTARTKSDVVTAIIDLLIASFADPMLRRANSHAFRMMIHPLMSQVLMPYMDDADKDVQANVLTCLAANQNVQAIPRIIELEERTSSKKEGLNMVMGLSIYTTPAAVPYLNPALFSICWSTRYEAVQALRNIGNRTSIPYLVAALQDSSIDISYGSYATLCRLIPSFEPLQTTREYEKHQQEMLKPVYAWWRDELSGKHLPHAN